MRSEEAGWELCINPACLRWGTPLQEFLEVSAAAGFGWVEVSIQQAVALANDLGGMGALARMVGDLGLRFGQFSGLLPAGPVLPAPLLVNEHAWREAQSTLASRLEAAATLGCLRAAVTCNPRTSLPPAEARRIAVDRLRVLAAEASWYGITLDVEFVGVSIGLDPTLDGRHGFITDLPSVVGLVDEVGSSNIDLLLDTCHLLASGAGPESIRRSAAERIGFVHLSGWPVGITADGMRDSLRCAPGEGTGDDACSLLPGVAAAGYQGPVSIELFSSDFWAMPPDAAAKRLLLGASEALGREPRR
jgi:sugar phosphate isomerase/epimerase